MASFEDAKRPSSNMADFRAKLRDSQHVVVLTGAGVSAESGVPTFRGAGNMSFWRRWQVTDLATPEAFGSKPSLVWEFYSYRRDVMLSKHPNDAHKALAGLEECMTGQGRRVTVITQNIDGLHARAGSKNIIELHGNLFKTRCTSCGDVRENYDNPLCEGLRGKGAPEVDAGGSDIPIQDLPKCEACGSLVRPHVVWFGEALDAGVLQATAAEIENCDMCLVVGTSSQVYPAASFAPACAARGVPVAEFNVEITQATHGFSFYFEGPAGKTVSEALAP